MQDPFGHVWHIATHTEDVPMKELKKRARWRGWKAEQKRSRFVLLLGGGGVAKDLGWRICAAGVMLAALAACGGGGGGGEGDGGGSAPLQYSGNSGAANLSTSNAAAISANAIGGGSGIAGTISSISGTSAGAAGDGQVDIGRRLSRTVRATVTSARGASRLTAVPVSVTEACPGGGTVSVAGDVNPANGTGTLTITYSGCALEGVVFTGQGSIRIDAFDFGSSIPTDVTLSFGRLSLRGAVNADVGGSLRVQTNLGANAETITENMVALNISTGRMTKSENLVFHDVYNNIFSPSSYTESINGRVYDSVHGYVDIITNAALVFPSLTQPFPSSGEILLTGASGRRVRVTANSATVAVLALDLDGNGTFEREVRLSWSGLSGTAGADLLDTDGDGMHNSWETAFGLNPNVNDSADDPDSDGFDNLAEYNGGTNPMVADATLPPPPGSGPLPPGPASGFNLVLPNNSALVYDPVSDRIYAAVRGSPGSVVPINPGTGSAESPIAVGIDPVELALSDDGQYLYVGLEGEPQIQRIVLATRTVDLTIALGSDPFLGPRFAEDIEVLPGNPGSIAVSLRNKGFSPRHAGVAIYDGSVPRPGRTPGHTGSNVIEFSASAATLYGYNNETTGFGFSTMAVGPNGVTVTNVHDSFHLNGALISGFGVDIKFGGGFVFSTSGRMVDPIARTIVRTFALPQTFGNLVTVEPSLNRVFYQTGNVIRAFHIGSEAEVGSASVTGMSGAPGSLIRWGAKGLAFRTSDGQIFIVQSTSWIP